MTSRKARFGFVSGIWLGLVACQSSSSATADAGATEAGGGRRIDATTADSGVGVHDASFHDALGTSDGHAPADAAKDTGNPDGAAVVPAPALAVGYTTQTFNSTRLGTTPGTWQDFTFYGVKQPAGAAVQNADGSLSLPGTSGDTYGATVATAAANSSEPEKWQGLAFGGGGYFEATLAFTGTPDGTDDSPAFWADDVEHSSGYLPTTAGHTWVEIDDLETDVASDSQWGQSLHNWYNAGAGNVAANPPTILAGNPVTIPDGGVFSDSHTYAFLWVPATATTQGYVEFFCDDVQIGGSAHYNQYSASQPFPPSGSDIGNVLDTLHLYLILGSDSTKYPATVTSVQVWQASDAGNLSY
jgi:hypothetical protein